MATTPIQITEDISLTEYRATDVPALVQYLNEIEIYNNTLNIPHPYTREVADTWISLKEQQTKEGGRPVSFVIRDEKEALIGGTGFENLQIGKTHKAELGYWLAKPYWNQGIMTRVVKGLCKFAFDEFGLIKITARTFSFNQRSSRVLEKCGFVREGFAKKHVKKRDQYLDVNLYALLKNT